MYRKKRKKKNLNENVKNEVHTHHPFCALLWKQKSFNCRLQIHFSQVYASHSIPPAAAKIAMELIFFGYFWIKLVVTIKSVLPTLPNESDHPNADEEMKGWFSVNWRTEKCIKTIAQIPVPKDEMNHTFSQFYRIWICAGAV